MQINPFVWSVNVTALLRKSTATDFLQRVKENRAAECFPEDCSTEVGEAEELAERYVSFLLIVLCIFFHPVACAVKGNYYTLYYTAFI